MSATEWFGEPHVLVVHSVTPPVGPLDDGEMDYEIVHAPSCKPERRGEGEHSYTEWVCDVAWNIDNAGLAFLLRYSGTPVTAPGTYRIQAWGNKRYVWDAWAYEYDGGIGVMAIDAGPCCHLHKPEGCCDPNDCGPCCENCPTCPTLARQRGRGST